MKKLLILISAIILPCVASANYESLTTGDIAQSSATGKLVFFGKTPVSRPANTASSQEVLQTLGLQASGGVDQSMHHVQVSLTAAEVFTLYSVGKQLVAAQGAGKTIVVSKIVFTITRTSTAFTGGGAVIMQYDSTVHGGGTQACDSTLASTVITGSAGTTESVRNGAIISDAASTLFQNKALYIGAATADFAAGTGTATVDVFYYVNG